MQKLKKADRELVLRKVLTEAFEGRFNALRDEMHAQIAADVAAAHPRFVELYSDVASKPYIAYQHLHTTALPDGRIAYRPCYGRRVEEPNTRIWYGSADDASAINLSAKTYLPAPANYSAKLTDEAVQAKYNKAWADYTAAYDKVSAVLNSYTTREKLAEDFPDFAKHIPLAQKIALPSVIVSDVLADLAAVGVPPQ